MKQKRIAQTVSLILVLVLTLQLIPPAMFDAWGQTAEAAGSVGGRGYTFPNSTETDNTVDAQVPSQVEDKTGTVAYPNPDMTTDDIRYLELLRSYDFYWQLPAGAVTFLVNYTGISTSEFQTMTQKGKNLVTAIKIGTLAKESGCSVSEILALNLSDAGYQEISMQMPSSASHRLRAREL